MSEEEKKAIELLKKLQKKTPYIIWGDGTPYNKNNQIQTILNLIDRLQKEIEELKEINEDNAEKSLLNDIFIKNNYISKDKIREAIKNREIELYADNPENDFIPYDKVIDTLKELLEEK